jgi:hypothetical protein
MKVLGTMILVAGAGALLLAGAPPAAPEIHPDSASTAVALLSGTLLILKSRRKK